jgi:MFS family permease
MSLPSLLRTPGVARLLAVSILARIPLAGVGVLLLVHARELTGSFAVGGAAAGANALAMAAGGPLLGRLVDRRGQTMVLAGSAALCAAALLGAAALPHGASALAIAALAAAAGATQPPLNACARGLWPAIMRDESRLHAAYGLETAALEITYIIGPAALLGLAALASTATAVAVCAAHIALGTALFAALRVSRGWRPEGVRRGAGGALSSPGLRTLMAICVLIGALLCGVEVAIPAAMMDTPGAIGPLLALWGVGSLAGGLLVARAGGVQGARGFALALAGLAGGHLLLVAADGPVALGALLVLAGAAVAPTFATTYALVNRVAPPGTITESFAWLSTALAIGLAAGGAGAGALADIAGARAAFAAAAGAAALTLVVLLARRPTLYPVAAPPAPPVEPALAPAGLD